MAPNIGTRLNNLIDVVNIFSVLSGMDDWDWDFVEVVVSLDGVVVFVSWLFSTEYLPWCLGSNPNSDDIWYALSESIALEPMIIAAVHCDPIKPIRSTNFETKAAWLIRQFNASKWF